MSRYVHVCLSIFETPNQQTLFLLLPGEDHWLKLIFFAADVVPGEQAERNYGLGSMLSTHAGRHHCGRGHAQRSPLPLHVLPQKHQQQSVRLLCAWGALGQDARLAVRNQQATHGRHWRRAAAGDWLGGAGWVRETETVAVLLPAGEYLDQFKGDWCLAECFLRYCNCYLLFNAQSYRSTP